MERKSKPIIVFASHSKGKLREVKNILGDISSVIPPQDICPSYQPPPEDTGSFAGNSKQKALALWKQLAHRARYGVLADDSGIEVEALGGEPGVNSAIYAGLHGDDEANRQKLLRELGQIQHRRARMVCVLTYVYPKPWPKYHQICRYVEGSIAFSQQAEGEESFGYDCLFIPTTDHSTLLHLKNQLPAEDKPRSLEELGKMLQGKAYSQWPLGWKNQTSHRYCALKDLRALLAQVR